MVSGVASGSFERSMRRRVYFWSQTDSRILLLRPVGHVRRSEPNRLGTSHTRAAKLTGWRRYWSALNFLDYERRR